MSSQNGSIAAIRFWKATTDSGSHTGRLWTDSGTLLTSAVFTNETASGWQEQALPTAFAISANVVYRVSYNVNKGQNYTVGAAYPMTNGPLTATAGCKIGSPGSFPTSCGTTNYFADVTFVSGTAPTPTQTRTFTQTPTQAGTFTQTPTPASTFPSTPTQTRTFTPTPTRTRTFTPTPTQAGPTTPTPTSTTLTIFTTQVPGTTISSKGHELGTQFKSSQNGTIVALRFWKATTDSGTHTGRLWTDSGTLLTSVVFTNETASGWQEQALPAPFAISANVVYRVSYNVRDGQNYTTGAAYPMINGPLTATAGCKIGSPGTFPTSCSDTYYFSDVRFSQ